SGAKALVMKSDTRIVRIIAVKRREAFRRFGFARCQQLEGRLVARQVVRSITLLVDRFEDFGLSLPPLDDKAPHGAAFIAHPARDIPGNAQRRADRLVQALQSRAGVERIAERSVVQPLAGSDIADEGEAGMHTDAGPAERDALRLLLG